MLFDLWAKVFARRQRAWLSPLSTSAAAQCAEEVVVRHDRGERFAISALTAQLRRSPYSPPLALLLELLIELRELFYQHLGLRAHPVQIQAVLLLLAGYGCQLRTGEGKSLVAALAAAAAASAGRRVSVYTVNDYLAERDLAEFQCCFDALGLRAEALLESEQEAQRLQRYSASILYMAPRVAIFDRIRQQVRRAKQLAEQPRWAEPPAPSALDKALADMAIVDEADALLIDEATVPFVLSAPVPLVSRELALLEEVVVALGEVAEDELIGDGRQRRLLDETRQRLLEHLQAHYAGRYSSAVLGHALEQGVTATFSLLRDRDYVVRDGCVEIVDSHTGRPSPDRRWEQGLHQLVELKEGLAPTDGSRTEAMLIYPEFFASFRFLSGMSGTLQGVRRELRRNYRMGCRRLQTHHPLALQTSPLVVARDSQEQLELLCQRLEQTQKEGRAALIGTATVSRSQQVSDYLTAAQIPHQLLNATSMSEESAIIAAAGQSGRITVATAMAGRGTDIKLAPTVRNAGGLEVILLDRQELRRNDAQFYGRAGRQGDPGSVAMLLSLDDELFGASILGSEEAAGQRSLAALLLATLPVIGRSRLAALLLSARQWYIARTRRKQRDQLKKEQQRLKSFYAVIGNRTIE